MNSESWGPLLRCGVYGALGETRGKISRDYNVGAIARHGSPSLVNTVSDIDHGVATSETTYFHILLIGICEPIRYILPFMRNNL